MELEKTLATPSEEMEAQKLNNLEEPQTEVEGQQEENTEDTQATDNNSEETESTDSAEDIWDIDDLEEIEDNVFSSDEGVDTEENTEEVSEKEPTQEEEQKQGVLITKPLKYRGKEIYIDNEDELIELAQKGLDYSFKMNKIKPYRKLIDELEAGSVTQEDIKALIDAKNGNKSAIKYLLNAIGSTEEDLLFSDEENDGYEPNVEPVDEVKEYYETLTQREPALAGKVLDIYNQLDDSFKNEVYNPQLFPAFVNSVKTGEFEEVYPRAVAVKASNPTLSWIQAYQIAIQNTNVGSKQKEPESAVKRKPNSHVKQNSKKKTIEDAYNEIWNDKVALDEIEKKIFR